MNRNDFNMISVTKYKNRPAILVKGDNLSATFLPLDGAKLASLKTNLGKIEVTRASNLFYNSPSSYIFNNGFVDFIPRNSQGI